MNLCRACQHVIALLVFYLAAGVAASVLADDEDGTASGSSQLYVNLNLIDGTGAALQRDKAILVRDGRIVRIADMEQVTTLAETADTVYDGTGLYALPGLIDTHVHLATVPEEGDAPALLRRQLYGGITGVRDMAGDTRVLANLARSTRLQLLDGPDVYYSALMAGPSFFEDPRPASSSLGERAGQVPWMQAIRPDPDLVQAVALARGTSATGIKIYADLPAETVRRISDEGHRQGIKVWAHSMVFPALPHEVVAAGVDTISHVCRLVYEASEQRPTRYHHQLTPDYSRIDPADPRITAVFKLMQNRGTILDATLNLYASQQARAALAADTRALPYQGCPPAFAAALVRSAVAAGVLIATGTDFVNPESAMFPALFAEMQALVSEAGMSPLQVISAASLNGARVLGITDQVGSLEEGKRADMLLLRANPLNDLANLETIVAAVKGGRQYARHDYDPLTPAPPWQP